MSEEPKSQNPPKPRGRPRKPLEEAKSQNPHPRPGKPKRSKPNTKKPITPQQAKFVQEFLRSGKQTEAAVAAGYSKATAPARATRLLQNCAAVKEVIEEARKAVVEKGTYNLEKAMSEADDAIQFAQKTNNANAYVKAVELKAKLNGLLIEKHDVRLSGFAINISGLEDLSSPLPFIDVTSTPVTALPAPATPAISPEDDIFA